MLRSESSREDKGANEGFEDGVVEALGYWKADGLEGREERKL